MTPYEKIQEQRRGLPPADDWLEKRKEREREAKAARAADIATLPPKGKRPHCLDCSKELEVYTWYSPTAAPARKYGYMGNNKFCTLRCGFNWALAHT